MKLTRSKLTLLLVAALLTSSCSVTASGANSLLTTLLIKLFPFGNFGVTPASQSDTALLDVWVAESASNTALSTFLFNSGFFDTAKPVKLLSGVRAGGITAFVGLNEGGSTMYLWHDGVVEVLTPTTTGGISSSGSITIAPGIQSFTVGADGGFGYATAAGSTMLYVVDLSKGSVSRTIDLGPGAIPTTAAVWVDSTGLNTVYVTDAAGYLHIVDPSSGTDERISTPIGTGGPGAAVTPDGTQLWIARGSLVAYDTKSKTLVSTFDPTPYASEIVFSLDGTSAYVLYSPPSGSGSIRSIDTKTAKTNWTADIGTRPRGLFLSPFGTFVLVANSGDGDIAQISTATGAQLSLTDVGTTPVGAVALNEAGTPSN